MATRAVDCVVILCALVLAGCNSADDTNPPCSKYQLCTLKGTTWSCDCGGGTTTACASEVNSGDPCNPPSDGTCMYCPQGATVLCACSDAGPHYSPDGGGSGPTWMCVGGGAACQ